jgi:hypothetical protein
MTLKDQSFVNKFKVSFVCNPEDVWPSNFGKCLKMSQGVILVTKNSFSQNILNFVQSFVECKVSLANGININYSSVRVRFAQNNPSLFQRTRGRAVKQKWRRPVKISRLSATISTRGRVWCIGQATRCCSGACLMHQCMHQESENFSINSPRGLMRYLRRLELLIFCINGLKLWDWVTATRIKPELRCINFICWCIKMECWRALNSFTRFSELGRPSQTGKAFEGASIERLDDSIQQLVTRQADQGRLRGK